jgi:hypothetical protein
MISTVASCILVYTIFNSREKLTTTRNRLLFGLSVSDIIYSACAALHTIPAPVDTHNKLFTHAYGNQITCNIQGFLFTVFGMISPSYNSMLTIYFLCVVKCDVSDEVISKKIEPYMHIVPMLYALTVTGVALSQEYINPTSGLCWINTVPDECAINPSIECERGGDQILFIAIITIIAPIFVSFVTIITSMSVLYCTVHKQEITMSRYSQLSFGQARGNQDIDRDQNVSFRWFRRAVSNSRKIMHQAIGYACAFFLSYTTLVIHVIIILATGESNIVMCFVTRALFPMQGLFNFIVFIFPKVTRQLRSDREFSLWQGIIAAIQCRPIARRRSSLVLARDRGRTPHRPSSDTNSLQIATPSFDTAVNDRVCPVAVYEATTGLPKEGNNNIENKKKYIRFDTIDTEETVRNDPQEEMDDTMSLDSNEGRTDNDDRCENGNLDEGMTDNEDRCENDNVETPELEERGHSIEEEV